MIGDWFSDTDESVNLVARGVCVSQKTNGSIPY